MRRRTFLKTLSLSALPALTGCGVLKVDPWHVLLRSDLIDNMDQESKIVSKARLEWTENGAIRVLYLKGSAYERGYQHGKLLQKEIQDNFNYMYKKLLSKYHFEELFDEAYERIRPYLADEFVEEMHGLAHGSRMPLHVIHGIHALPSVTEWGGKKHVKEVVKMMMNGDLSTTCSNFMMRASATSDGKMYVVRVLDWGLHRVSKLHEYPLLTVSYPERGIPNVNIGWVGFVGAVSGMNAEGITLGEMGYGDPAGETMRGKPMVFLLREILNQAKSLKDVRHLISSSKGDMSFIYMFSDGKTGEAEMYVRDKDRFLVFKPGQELKDKDNDLPAIKDMVYGGHYPDRMHQCLQENQGKLTPEILMRDVIPKVAMPSNFQNVIYDPKDLKFWVANAKSREDPAFGQPYTFFDFGKVLR